MSVEVIHPPGTVLWAGFVQHKFIALSSSRVNKPTFRTDTVVLFKHWKWLLLIPLILGTSALCCSSQWRTGWNCMLLETSTYGSFIFVPVSDIPTFVTLLDGWSSFFRRLLSIWNYPGRCSWKKMSPLLYVKYLVDPWHLSKEKLLSTVLTLTWIALHHSKGSGPGEFIKFCLWSDLGFKQLVALMILMPSFAVCKQDLNPRIQAQVNYYYCWRWQWHQNSLGTSTIVHFDLWCKTSQRIWPCYFYVIP